MSPRYTREYLREFMRVLRPGGLLLFQLLSEPLSWRGKIKQRTPQWAMQQFYQFKYGQRPVMEIHGIPQADIVALLETYGGQIIDIKKDQRAFDGWSSFQYCVTRT